MIKRNVCTRYSFAVEADAYRKRFDTSDSIILAMVQKGKVEETILESVPQLIIQLINQGLLGQLKNIPPTAAFSIALSVMSLTNTLWYYSFWNLYKCVSIREVPSALALYNYKLEGVTDGPYSFGKASRVIREIVDIELEDIESATASGSLLNTVTEDADSDAQLVTVQLPLRTDS